MSLVNAALQEMLVEVEARLPSKKLLVTLIFCVLCFLLSCLLSSQNGLYAMNLLDAYVGGLAVPIVALYGVVAITWIYGPHNVARDIEFIHGTPVHSVTMLLWKFVCPIILLLTALSPLAAFGDMAKIGAYAYPLWASVMGCLVVIGCLVIIAGACLAAYRKHNRNVQEAVRPNRLWGPKDPMLMDAYRHVRRSSLRRQLALAVLDTDT
ncbi:sodium- and chloride-dependent glycine transporter 1-like [Haemaphysalis longicornis]